jgi:protease I
MDIKQAQIPVLAEDQYQELEFWYPLLWLCETGANGAVAPAADQVYMSKLGYPFKADLAISEIEAAQLDAVVVPGGSAPEGIRRRAPMVKLVRTVHDQGCLAAAICYAGWVPPSAQAAKGRRVTCVPIIKDNVVHDRGNYVGEPVVRDGNIITSRLPGVLPDYCREIRELSRRDADTAQFEAALTLVKGRPPIMADNDGPAKFVTMRRHRLSKLSYAGGHRAGRPGGVPPRSFGGGNNDRKTVWWDLSGGGDLVARRDGAGDCGG